MQSVFNKSCAFSKDIPTYTLAALFLIALIISGGCIVRSKSFGATQAGSLPALETIQNPTPVDPSIHVYGPTNKVGFAQQYQTTTVLDPKLPLDQNVISTTTTTITVDTRYVPSNP
ncbi:MAG: hypothetical protein O3B75_11140 [Planctomycetota bacterium]|nr:hypothetical protein [Planctomycetota bacterium]